MSDDKRNETPAQTREVLWRVFTILLVAGTVLWLMVRRFGG